MRFIVMKMRERHRQVSIKDFFSRSDMKHLIITRLIKRKIFEFCLQATCYNRQLKIYKLSKSERMNDSYR